MKYTLNDHLNGDCSSKEYREQFKSPEIKLGAVYIQHPDTWCEKHYKILFMDNKIALGITVYNKISNKYIGDYELFNVNDGWKYQDIREEYRLTKEIKKG